MKEILPRVYACGFPSAETYEAQAHFILSPHGNILIEAPEFVPRLATELEFFGGVQYVFLTHRDDVGDTCRFKERFQSQVIMHREEQEYVDCGVDITFSEDYRLTDEVTLIATPGHSPGSSCLLFHAHGGVLFCGDHLMGNNHGLVRPVRFEWTWDWARQLESARRLLDYRFSFVVPSHASLEHGYIGNAREALQNWLIKNNDGGRTQ